MHIKAWRFGFIRLYEGKTFSNCAHTVHFNVTLRFKSCKASSTSAQHKTCYLTSATSDTLHFSISSLIWIKNTVEWWITLIPFQPFHFFNLTHRLSPTTAPSQRLNERQALASMETRRLAIRSFRLFSVLFTNSGIECVRLLLPVKLLWGN